MKARYLLNRRSGVLHKLPTQEGCNADQIPRPFRIRLRETREVAQWPNVRVCRRCFAAKP